jgi:UTP-glucose-1-phosphate uridylyltransferase/galactokinase
MTGKKIELFVPGRLCLIGEHSDWAGRYRNTNSQLLPGEAIVTGIEQGIYAEVEKDDSFIVESELESFAERSFHCEMDSEQLRQIAAEGGFFSYVAGVASYVNDNYNVGGLHIRITKMDLPMKRGLSSSAAICVLVARAFNQMYKLKLNTMGEMQIAFAGEQRTPSRCGQLDQACAYGVKPVHMLFDGNEIIVKPLKIAVPMYYVFADLNAGKDTVRILADLNKAFPFAENEMERQVQEALGKDNHAYVTEAIDCIHRGDNASLGQVMRGYQKNFDQKIAPASYKELRSPVLHSVLQDEKIQELVYGMKGVGSQGDGTVQFLAKDEKCQERLIQYLRDERKMEAFALTLNPKQRISRAIIPVAGFGTRLFPTTKIMKKDFFPIMDKDGILKPVLLILLEQLIEAGIEEVCLVIGEEEQPIYDEFFGRLPRENYEKLPEDKKYYQNLLMKIGKKVTYVYQRQRKGFGHAVYQCREFTGDEPVLLLLGDMIYRTGEERNCMKQMIEAYETIGTTMISMHTIPKEDVVHYGIMHGEWENSEETLLKLDEIAEKPSVEYAEDYLAVKTRKNRENYYAVFGQYILTREVFQELEKNIAENKLERGEIQLTSALDQVREKYGVSGFVVNGRSYDVGLPEAYYRTFVEIGRP